MLFALFFTLRRGCGDHRLAVEGDGDGHGEQLSEKEAQPHQLRLHTGQKQGDGEQENDLAQQGDQQRAAAAVQGLEGGGEDNAHGSHGEASAVIRRAGTPI